MKKILLIMLVLANMLVFSSCDSGVTEDEEVTGTVDALPDVDRLSDERIINLSSFNEERVTAFCYDAENNFYYCNGWDIVYQLDNNGNPVAEYNLGFKSEAEYSNGNYDLTVVDLAVADEYIYYILFTNEIYQNEISYIIRRFNTTSGITEELDKISGTEISVKCKLRIAGNKLVYSIPDPEYSETAVSAFSTADGFSYGGERIRAMDTETLEINDVGVDLPVSFSLIAGSEIYIAAYDEVDGYYYIKYNTENGTFGEKEVNNIVKLRNFEMTETEDYAVCYTNAYEFYLIKISDAERNFSIVDGYMPTGNKFLVRQNSIFFANADINNDSYSFVGKKYSINELIKNKIKLIGIDWLPSLGFTLEKQSLEWDETALRIMANDSSWDICFMNSTAEFDTLVEKGLYYPLNGVPEIESFYEKAFPYVRDAAVTADGSIWGLIYEVSDSWLAYNPEKVKEFGVNLSADDDFYTLTEKINLLKSFDASIIINENDFYYDSLMDYSLKFQNAEAEKLKEFAETIYRISHGNENWLYNVEVVLKYNNDIMDKYFAHPIEELNDECLWTDFNTPGLDMYVEWGLDFLPVPSAFGDTYLKNCKMILVNPLSKNIEYALEYLAKLSQYIIENDQSFMFNDKEVYNKEKDKTAIFEKHRQISEKSQIEFALPEDIFYYVFNDYLNGTVSLDEMSDKINNNLSMYYNE